MRIHIYHHHRYNNDLMDLIIQKLDTIMGKQQDLEAAIVRLNTVTNDIAADLTLLKAAIENDTVTDDQLTRLDTTIATLETLGASTENPVPDPNP